MPKSKLRGGAKKHRTRIQERNLIKKRKDEKMQRMFMEQMKKIQEDTIKAQEQEVVNVDDMGDIGEFGLDEDVTEALENVAEVVEEQKTETDNNKEKV